MIVPPRHVAFLATDGVEEVELTEPWKAISLAGLVPRLVALEPGEIQAFNHLDRGDTHRVDLTVDEASAPDFAALVLPGGVANPDALRTNRDAVDFVRGFRQAGLPIAAICHAPWVLAEANLVRARRLTSWPSLETDLRNAGATWVDEEVVLDNQDGHLLITSRRPDDLPAFCDAVLGALEPSRLPA